MLKKNWALFLFYFLIFNINPNLEFQVIHFPFYLSLCDLLFVIVHQDFLLHHFANVKLKKENPSDFHRTK